MNAVSPYWFNSSITITASASDLHSGVASVELWYRYSTNNATWGGWTLFGTDTAAPWSWSFNFPNGSGYYRFYSRAKDNVSNYEEAPTVVDATAGYDAIAPSTPSLISPENGNKTWDRTPTFSWYSCADSGPSGIWGYQIQIRYLGNATIYKEIFVETTSYTSTDPYFLSFHNYSWRIQARDNAGNYGDWSETRTITIYKVWGVILTAFPWTQSVSSGGTATYEITVTNLGNDKETFYINITSNTTGWTASLSANWINNLDYGNTASVILTVTAPNINYGTGYVSVLATSQTNTSCCSAITIVTYIPVPPPEPPECQPITVVGLESQFGPFSADISVSFSFFCNRYLVVEGNSSFVRPGIDTPHFAAIIQRLQERRPFIDWRRGIVSFFTLYDNVPTYTNLIEPGGTYTYQITITNPSDSTVTIYLTPFGIQLDSWHAVLDRAEVTLGPYESIIVNLTVIAPLQTEEYQATIIVSGTLENALIVQYAVVTATLTTWMNPVYLSYIEPTRAQLWDAVNATPSDEFLLNALKELNNSVNYATMSCTLEQAFNCAYGAIKYLQNVDSNVSESIIENILYAVRVASERAISFADLQSMKNTTYICKGVEWCAIAMSSSSPTTAVKYFTLAYMCAIEHKVEDYYSFEISISPEVQIKAGETANYTITITNTGVLDDKYDLSLITDISSSWINFPTTNIEIPANGSATILLQFTSPSDLPLMYNTTYQFEIRVTSVYAIDINDNALGESVSQRLTVIATKESKIRYMINEVEELMTTLDGMDIQQGVKNSLKSKLENALDKLNTALDDTLNGDENHADKMIKCAQNKLNAFINEVEAQRGKKISNEDADILVNAAQTIIEHINDTITIKHPPRHGPSPGSHHGIHHQGENPGNHHMQQHVQLC